MKERTLERGHRRHGFCHVQRTRPWGVPIEATKTTPACPALAVMADARQLCRLSGLFAKTLSAVEKCLALCRAAEWHVYDFSTPSKLACNRFVAWGLWVYMRTCTDCRWVRVDSSSLPIAVLCSKQKLRNRILLTRFMDALVSYDQWLYH